jgi:predicted aconitase with swiveling domain
MVRGGVGPAALVMQSCDTTVAVGAIIAEIPCVDQVDISSWKDGDQLWVADDEVGHDVG